MNYKVEFVKSAKEAHTILSEKGWNFYNVIVTDITMESQLAGILMLRKIFKNGFKGTIIVASTGFDFPGVTTLSRMFLGTIGVNYIIPKGSINNGKPLFHPIGFKKDVSNTFEELI